MYIYIYKTNISLRGTTRTLALFEPSLVRWVQSIAPPRSCGRKDGAMAHFPGTLPGYLGNTWEALVI